MPPPTQPASPATAVTRGEDGVETETGDQDCKEGEAEPPLAKMTISVITGADIIILTKIITVGYGCTVLVNCSVLGTTLLYCIDKRCTVLYSFKVLCTVMSTGVMQFI